MCARRSNRHRIWLAAALLAAPLLSGCSSPPDTPTDPLSSSVTTDTEGSGLLDGQEKSFVIVGYSTSYAWPEMLQDMLDEHAGNHRVYHVLNAVAGGAPVEHWIAEPGDPNYKRTIGAMQSDFFGDDARLRGDAPPPSIAVCQQSLQFTMDLRGPVKAEHDMVGAEMGADAIEKMALRLRDLGLAQVHIAMHIYKQPVEPEVGNERIALARLLDRGHDFVHQGPDICTVTRDCYPDCFEDDGLHPNVVGTKLMAEHWYRHIAGTDAREDIVERMQDRDYEIRPMMQEYLAWRRGE